MTSEAYLEALLALPGLAGGRVSPDGRWVAWSWFRTGPFADVWLAPSNGSAAPVRLTDTPQDTFLASWVPDSSAVLVQQDEDGNERTQLFRVDLARPGAMLPLTEPNPSFFLRGGQLHPNGRWLVYGANWDEAAGEEIEPTCVYRHDLETDERVMLARPEKGGFSWPSLNREGRQILYTRRDLDPSGTQVWMVDIEGREDREILNFGAAVKTAASWFPDSRRVLVLSERETHRRLGVWDRETGVLRWLLDDPARNIESAHVPLGSERIIVQEVREARSRISFMDPETAGETLLPAIPGDLIPLAPTADGAWVGQYSSSRQPADLVRFAPTDVRPEAFTSLTRVWERTSLRRENLAPAEEFRWRSTDGLEIQGWLYRAPGAARGAIVSIHGGPTAHSADRLNNQIQFFVNRGFHVLDPNYRGSTGFSLQFRESIKADGWGGREQEDIIAGIQALIDRGIAQPGKIGVTGGSYGGYSSWCLITRCPPEIVAASAPVCGMTDLVVDYETTRPDLRPYSEEMMGGSPAQAPERYRERSPIHFVGKIRGRLLIVQGLRDPNVSPENVRAVRGALDAAGVPYEVLQFADEGHGIGRPANQKTLYLRLAEFFERAFAESGESGRSPAERAVTP